MRQRQRATAGVPDSASTTGGIATEGAVFHCQCVTVVDAPTAVSSRIATENTVRHCPRAISPVVDAPCRLLEAELPLRVLLVTVSVPLQLKMPPPQYAELPLRVLLVTVTVPWL